MLQHNVRFGKTPVPVVFGFYGDAAFMAMEYPVEVCLKAEDVPLEGDTTIGIPEMRFPSVRHALTAWRMRCPDARERIRHMSAREVEIFADSPEAKALCRRDAWRDPCVQTLLGLCRQKYAPDHNPKLWSGLRNTYTASLVYLHERDRLYGFTPTRGGDNLLGRVTMTVRDEYRICAGYKPALTEPVLPATILNPELPLPEFMTLEDIA